MDCCRYVYRYFLVRKSHGGGGVENEQPELKIVITKSDAGDGLGLGDYRAENNGELGELNGVKKEKDDGVEKEKVNHQNEDISFNIKIVPQANDAGEKVGLSEKDESEKGETNSPQKEVINAENDNVEGKAQTGNEEKNENLKVKKGEGIEITEITFNVPAATGQHPSNNGEKTPNEVEAKDTPKETTLIEKKGNSDDAPAAVRFEIPDLETDTNRPRAQSPTEVEIPEGFLTETELEKIVQSTYRYSYHQYVENHKEGESFNEEM